MPPPSALSIATSVVHRLTKEEASYHKELEAQQARLQNLEANPGTDENAEFHLRQERQAIEETRAVFPPLRQRIADAVSRLVELLEAGDESGAAPEEVARAREVVGAARGAMAEGE